VSFALGRFSVRFRAVARFHIHVVLSGNSRSQIWVALFGN
jgi:hypothetical protein